VPYLEIVSKEGKRRLALGQGPVNIGRCPTNMIRLDDDLTGRAHCVVEMTPHGYQLRDLASCNGTYCNNKEIKTMLLNDGDEFQVGVTMFRFVQAEDDEA